ncbi:MAG: glycosyltransferase family 4 protein, partial [Halobacteriota archaeon]
MKLNVIAAFPEYKDGIPRVAEELIKQICAASVVDSVSIITREDLSHVSSDVLANGKVSLFATGRFLTPWTLLKVMRLYKAGDFFLLFVPPWDVFDPLPELYFFLFAIKYGFLPRCKWVQLIHDFIPYVYGDDTDERKRTLKLFDTFKKHFLTVPTKYVAVSESTKRDAVRYWGLPADKIEVIHHGSFVAPKKARSGFGSKKVTIVSDIAPRKNHIRLIEAFEKVYRTNPSDDLELIIVGHVRKNVPEFEEALSDIRRRNEGIKITICGYLTDSEILSLYEQADVFVYPSLYEGFGLPVLEAMACGCPVIASNISSLP